MRHGPGAFLHVSGVALDADGEVENKRRHRAAEELRYSAQGAGTRLRRGGLLPRHIGG